MNRGRSSGGYSSAYGGSFKSAGMQQTATNPGQFRGGNLSGFSMNSGNVNPGSFSLGNGITSTGSVMGNARYSADPGRMAGISSASSFPAQSKFTGMPNQSSTSQNQFSGGMSSRNYGDTEYYKAYSGGISSGIGSSMTSNRGTVYSGGATGSVDYNHGAQLPSPSARNNSGPNTQSYGTENYSREQSNFNQQMNIESRKLKEANERIQQQYSTVDPIEAKVSELIKKEMAQSRNVVTTPEINRANVFGNQVSQSAEKLIEDKIAQKLIEDKITQAFTNMMGRTTQMTNLPQGGSPYQMGAVRQSYVGDERNRRSSGNRGAFGPSYIGDERNRRSPGNRGAFGQSYVGDERNRGSSGNRGQRMQNQNQSPRSRFQAKKDASPLKSSQRLRQQQNQRRQQNQKLQQQNMQRQKNQNRMQQAAKLIKPRRGLRNLAQRRGFGAQKSLNRVEAAAKSLKRAKSALQSKEMKIQEKAAPKRRRIPCYVCLQNFENKFASYQHLQSHTPGTYGTVNIGKKPCEVVCRVCCETFNDMTFQDHNKLPKHRAISEMMKGVKISKEPGDEPEGVEYIVPVEGFICKVCNYFFTDEEVAHVDHCKESKHNWMLQNKKFANFSKEDLKKYIKDEYEKEGIIYDDEQIKELLSRKETPEKVDSTENSEKSSDKKGACVFIGNVKKSAPASRIWTLFNEIDIPILRVAKGRGKRYCHVYLTNDEDFPKVLKKLDNYEFDDQVLNVADGNKETDSSKEAILPTSPKQPNQARIFIGNVGKFASAKKIYALFEVIGVKLLNVRKTNGKQFCHVELANPRDMNKTIKKLHNYELDGVALNVAPSTLGTKRTTSNNEEDMDFS